VSLRDVSKAAGQRNHSAAQYHFGSRAGLALAVFEHRMRTVNQRRTAMLATVDPADTVGIVATLVRPLTSVVAETDGWYGRFLHRIQWDTTARDVLAELPLLDSYRRAVRLLAARRTDLAADVRAQRVEQVGTLLIGSVAAWEWRRQRRQPALTLDELDLDLISTLVAVVDAPAAPTRALAPDPWGTP
jgi:AcrR family transcriptional regulator